MPPPQGDPNAQAASAEAQMPPPPPSPTDPGMAPMPPQGDPNAMAQGAPPVDPAAGMPIDPATGMPMDPNAMAQGAPPPPMDPGQMPVMLTYQDLQQILMDAMDAKKGDSKGDAQGDLQSRVDTLEQIVADLAGGQGKMPADQVPPAPVEKMASLVQMREEALAKRERDILAFRQGLKRANGLAE